MTQHLTFSRPLGDGVTNYWAPKRTGDYATDCAAGKTHALEVVERLRDDPSQGNLIGCIVRDMIAADRYEGVEVGFCAEISRVIQGNRRG